MKVRMSTGFRSKKSHEVAVGLKRFEAGEKKRKVDELEQMIAELHNVAVDLDRQVNAEEERTGVKDPAHFAYSTLASSASKRRDNLRASIAGLMVSLDAAKRERDETVEQLDQLALSDEPARRDESRTRRPAERSTGRPPALGTEKDSRSPSAHFLAG